MTKPVVRVPANLPGPAFTADGLVNFVTRMGAGKSQGNTYFFNTYGQAQFDTAYRTSAWFKKIVNIPAEDATREWRAWKGIDKKQIEALEAEENRLLLRPRMLEAIKLARLYGGGVVIPSGRGALAESASTPLDVKRVGLGDLQGLAVIDRYSITAGPRDTDPFSEFYNQPTYYRVSLGSGVVQDIHPSRVIRILGNPIPGNLYWDGYGDSIWHTLRDAVSNADAVASGIADMLPEMKTDVVRVENLADQLATSEHERAQIKRWQAVAMLKSINSVFLLDKNDEWDQKSINWAGIPDIVDRLLTIMCGAADIPMTRMIGTSAKGLNATGEGDLRNYYDMVSARQELELTPAIRQLDEIVIRSALGARPPECWYAWRPLYAMSDKERADVEKVYAEALNIRVQTALFDDKVLAGTEYNRMIESEAYPGLEAAIADSEHEGGIMDPDEVAEEERMIAEASAAAAGLHAVQDVPERARRAANDKAGEVVEVAE